MTHHEVIHKLQQERLEKLRQDAQLRNLIKAHQPSLRLRTAQTLRAWAQRLSPEPETRHMTKESSWI